MNYSLLIYGFKFKEKGHQTLHWYALFFFVFFLLLSFETVMHSFMSDLIKSPKLVTHRLIAFSINYGALKLGVLLIFNSAYSEGYTIPMIFCPIRRIFIWATIVLIVNQVLIYHSHHFEIWSQFRVNAESDFVLLFFNAVKVRDVKSVEQLFATVCVV